MTPDEVAAAVELDEVLARIYGPPARPTLREPADEGPHCLSTTGAECGAHGVEQLAALGRRGVCCVEAAS